MPPVRPMLAKAVHELPRSAGLLYEPKWDGFRSIVFRDGDELELGSRNDRPLTRYFPELAELLQQALPERCVVDGEIVVVTDAGLDFDVLQNRLHPAASRASKNSPLKHRQVLWPLTFWRSPTANPTEPTVSRATRAT